MSKYKSSFINFAKTRMETQGDEIREWATSDNPLLSQICREVMEAAGQGEQK